MTEEVEEETMEHHPDPARLLVDSGLLFEINRTLLHPLGLALYVSEEVGVETLGGVLDARDDPEGIVFDAEQLADGAAKFTRYLAERGLDARASRLAAIGVVVQAVS